MLLKILVGINNKIQKQWAFFGPKWFCWLLVFFGFEFWFIEATFKALGFASYGPGYLLLNYIHEVFLDKKWVGMKLGSNTREFIFSKASFSKFRIIFWFFESIFLLNLILLFLLISKRNS